MADTTRKPSVFLRVTMNRQGAAPTALAAIWRRRPGLALPLARPADHSAATGA